MEDKIAQQIPPEIKKKLEKIKASVEKFKAELLKKFDKYVIGIALLPPPKKEEKEKAEDINILVLMDDTTSTKMPKEMLKENLVKTVDKISEQAEKNIKPQVMLLSELKENCFDGKYEVLELIAMSGIVYDKGMLSALKVAEVHKTMAIKKFEKYILSYVAAGSLFRGDANPQDIDVYVVVDDTDVKKMSRVELKDKLRAIISGMGMDAGEITGVKASFHVQTYILTDFWDSIKDANPVVYTFLRDGVPLFDRGVFMPWKLLLSMGKIKPSPEAIDFSMDIGEKLLQRVKHKLLSVVGEDLYYAALNPAQAALMLYGLPPPTPKETVQLLDDVFVKKEKLLEKRYVNILDKVRSYYKDVEHGKLKEIKGREIDLLLKDVSDYLKRINSLFKQIEKKARVRVMDDAYETCNAVTRDALLAVNQVTSNDLEKDFKTKLVDTGKLPEKMLRMYKDILHDKKEFDEKRLSKQEIEKVLKDARLYIKLIVEFIQRARGAELERARIRFKYENRFGELLLLDKVAFIIPDLEKREEIQIAELTNEGGIANVKKGSLEELERHLADAKIPERVFIKEKIFEDLRSLFGKDIEVMVSY